MLEVGRTMKGVIEMEKNCTLVKTLNVFDGKDGKKRNFVNYHLDFGNGVVIPITLRMYQASKTASKEDVERLESYNHDNYIRLNTLAFDVTK